MRLPPLRSSTGMATDVVVDLVRNPRHSTSFEDVTRRVRIERTELDHGDDDDDDDDDVALVLPRLKPQEKGTVPVEVRPGEPQECLAVTTRSHAAKRLSSFAPNAQRNTSSRMEEFVDNHHVVEFTRHRRVVCLVWG
jgi:hypothetical protein